MIIRLKIILILVPLSLSARAQDSLRLSGQLSSFINFNHSEQTLLSGGARYIPQVNYRLPESDKGNIDFEISLNIRGATAISPFDSVSFSSRLKPYRAWIRYSTSQLEIRAGLQKLNFGSAMMIRPLMWFDQIDQRDPLQLTDGVWGILGRYYFLDNTNIWLWLLYGNSGTRGWESIPVNKKMPEFGGRIQAPLAGGETALTYHHRIADSRSLGLIAPPLEKVPEHRIGFDSRWDLLTGLWLEGSFSHMTKDMGILTNLLSLSAGADYTFSAGNGIYVAAEHLLAIAGDQGFENKSNNNYTLLSASYPLGLFDRLSMIVYYGWKDSLIFTFMNWQKQFDKITLHLMTYWNPDTYILPSSESTGNYFAGKGIQLMLVYNH